MSYGPDLIQLYRRVGPYVSKILHGARPADLPIERPTKFDLVVNLVPVYTKALESLNPRLTWVFVVGICTGPTLAGKQIHLRDDQGQTLVIARGPEYKELAKNPLWEVQIAGAQQEAQSNPFYEAGRMYYRTPGFLYAIGEK